MKEIPTRTALTAVGEPQPQAERSPLSAGMGAAESDGLTLRGQRVRAEIQAIRQALEQTGWNRKQAARLLEISYRGLLYKIQKHRITRPSSSGGNGKAFADATGGVGQNWRVG